MLAIASDAAEEDDVATCWIAGMIDDVAAAAATASWGIPVVVDDAYADAAAF